MLNTDFRVLFVTNSLSGGGAERTTNILVNSLSQLGLSVALAPINAGPADLVTPKCQVFEIKRPAYGGPFSVIKSYIGLQRVISRWKPNIIVLNCDLPELLGSFLVGNFQLVVVEHSSTPWMQRLNLGKLVRQILKKRRSIWVGVSDHLSIWRIQDKPDYVIQNPVEIDAKLAKTFGGGISRLVFVGRLSLEKQPDWVVTLGKLTGLPVLFVGDGLLRKPLMLQAKRDSVVVDFKGFITDPWKLIAEGDLLIVPSAFEGDGLVVIEALIRKVPLLLNDIKAFRRFNLPEVNYCSGVDDFASRILKSQNASEEFIVNRNQIEAIVEKRSPSEAAYLWMQLISKVK
jgi:glycosyltransferase involved in cell wall biosynthesis